MTLLIMIYLFIQSILIAKMMKFHGQNPSESLQNSIIFAPCGLSYDPIGRSATRRWFKLESPDIDSTSPN